MKDSYVPSIPKYFEGLYRRNGLAAENFDIEHMFKPRNERGKVFAGRRRIVSKEVTSLFNLCLRLLMNNTREFINFDVVKPILEKCTPDELAHIERKHRVSIFLFFTPCVSLESRCQPIKKEICLHAKSF
uniref:Tnp_DDE_dom domain-containing protein n=1 Tax=Angiostrongylus cantonensis TaxID=6313 RepID=A0A0K0D5A9_ANGCA